MAPTHYSRLDPQPIVVAEKWGWPYHLATMLKYVARAGHKENVDELKDLAKAKWYLERHIQLVEAKQKGIPPPPPADQV